MGETVRLRFHASLYPADDVRRAAERFVSLVDELRVETPGPDVVVTLTGVPDRLKDRLGDELANHALFEAIRTRRGVVA